MRSRDTQARRLAAAKAATMTERTGWAHERGTARSYGLAWRARAKNTARAVPGLSRSDAVPHDGAAMLDVRGLTTTFETEDGTLRAVEDVSFHVPEGKTLGIVGESGCGKSVTALSILRLLPEGVGRIAAGRVELQGKDLVTLSERDMRAVRGNDISMIFQEPMTSLNPVYTVGAQIVEAVVLHQKVSTRQAKERAVEMLRLVGIHSPEENVHAYPHQLSGGMRQRVMIAMALACEPLLLLADEPTTALDVTIQAQILELLKGLQEKLGMSTLLITHDLGVVAEYTHHVVVMYAGRIVESAPVRDLFRSPHHPYTLGLLESLPVHVDGPRPARRTRLRTIEGLVPDLAKLPPGCRFADRCPLVVPKCREKEPELVRIDTPSNEEARPPIPGQGGRFSRCFRWTDVERTAVAGALPTAKEPS